MLKKIDVGHLRVGMHLHELCGSWMEHPFWRTKFVIHDENDIHQIVESGIKEVWIDDEKGLDVSAASESKDEVDAGVGGVAATALADLLANVAATAQVFVVTHLPQVAARATAHYAVIKHDNELLVRTDVHLLSPNEREVEIARMLSGSPDSSVARAHARELLGRTEG